MEFPACVWTEQILGLLEARKCVISKEKQKNGKEEWEGRGRKEQVNAVALKLLVKRYSSNKHKHKTKQHIFCKNMSMLSNISKIEIVHYTRLKFILTRIMHSETELNKLKNKLNWDHYDMKISVTWLIRESWLIVTNSQILLQFRSFLLYFLVDVSEITPSQIDIH